MGLVTVFEGEERRDGWGGQNSDHEDDGKTKGVFGCVIIHRNLCCKSLKTKIQRWIKKKKKKSISEGKIRNE